MAKAVRTYKGGIHGLIHAAILSDGVIFIRYQSKTAHGYRWGKWSAIGKCDPGQIPDTLSAGFSTLHMASGIYDKSLVNARLPNN
jgi:hypothetical protein